MGNLLSWLGLNKILLIVVMLAIPSLYGYGFYKGKSIERAKQSEARLILLQQIREKELEIDAVTRSYSQAYEIERARQKVVFKYLDREVIKYVTTNPNTSCFDVEQLHITKAAAGGKLLKDPASTPNKVQPGIRRSG